MYSKYKDRLLFLKQFTKELILQSRTSEEKPEMIKTKEELEIMVPSSLAEEIVGKEEFKPSQMPLLKPEPRYRVRLKPMALPKRIFQPITKQITSVHVPSRPSPPEFKPQITPIQELDLGKLNFLINDNRVTVIECPGPGKFILARTAGRVEVTKISLSEEEIKNIIEKFSEKTKIPVISGLFKAAIGNLILTAVISELVGSRFIITKITPLSRLEQVSQRAY